MDLKLPSADIKDFLDSKVEQYNNADFIESDPISIPHMYTSKEDMEISGFLAATIAWGNRKMIVKNANRLMDLMGNMPYEFIMDHREEHLEQLDGFVHRTFNSIDLKYFIKSLRNIYKNHGGLEKIFSDHATDHSTQNAICEFKKIFFSIEHPNRTTKHISDPNKGSAAKRINMFLRWMCRKDLKGVDFGIWSSIKPSALSCPLDVHSGNVSRKLGLLKGKQNDAKALLELDTTLRKLDSNDPVKYDFALFGLGVFEKF
ncbi:TIGR02757 family protein [Ichthyobacterium seriolicida]|uniref:TIGR02757 family protein n=1 Tax=Ichthyobacterium seriolicida TaxID=242600 RepID=A0A1J1E3G5_9FLAO|nr:TIGR02757 family protein [Ichthyobacterium seriolicida]BAV94588.1 hypothetical protein JBKA6_0575 [Ichthyobacterium seriolicida]